MADLEKLAAAAREYAQYLCATGRRHDNRETMMFCDAVEAADAPPAQFVEAASIQVDSAGATQVTFLAPPGERVVVTPTESKPKEG